MEVGSRPVLTLFRGFEMEAGSNKNKEQIVDVGSVVEAVTADDSDAPLYQVESLCMRCGENVLSLVLSLVNDFLFSVNIFDLVHCSILIVVRASPGFF